MVTIAAIVDDKDGHVIFRSYDSDMYKVQAFTVVGEFPNIHVEHSINVEFSPSLLSQFGFVNQAAKDGKKLRITIEAVDAEGGVA